MAVSADALQVYAGLEILTGAASAAERAELEHRLISFLPVDAQFSAGQYAELAHSEIDGLLAHGAAADRRRRDRAVPAGRARQAFAEAAARRGRAGALDRRAPTATARRLCTQSWRSGRRGRRRRSPRPTATGSCARSNCTTQASWSPPSAESELWTRATRHPDPAGRAGGRARAALRADRRPCGRDACRGRGGGGPAAHAAGASDTARKALGFDDLLAGDVDGMKRRTRNYARRQLTWMRKLPGVTQIDVTERLGRRRGNGDRRARAALACAR